MVFFEHLQDANVCQSSHPTAAQDKGDSRPANVVSGVVRFIGIRGERNEEG
jgi:hypothetical protein